MIRREWDVRHLDRIFIQICGRTSEFFEAAGEQRKQFDVVFEILVRTETLLSI